MTDALDEYNKKRDFDATPEPSGKARKRTRETPNADHALQFCIQKHDGARLHYDFRLEIEGTLKSWAVPKGPCLDPQVKRLAMHVEDHPLDSATFEGHIPEGHYGAGDVIVWDRGIWSCIGDPVESYKEGKIKFELQGEKQSGIWNLVRTHQEGKQKPWFLIKHQDAAVKPEAVYDVVKEQPDSVLSDRTIIPKKRRGTADPQPVEQVPKPRRRTQSATLTGTRSAPLPDLIKPQLATLVETAPSGDWRGIVGDAKHQTRNCASDWRSASWATRCSVKSRVTLAKPIKSPPGDRMGPRTTWHQKREPSFLTRHPSEAARAHQRMEKGEHIGKIVLQVV